MKISCACVKHKPYFRHLTKNPFKKKNLSVADLLFFIVCFLNSVSLSAMTKRLEVLESQLLTRKWESFTQQCRWGRGPLGVKGPTVTRSTGVDAWGMRPTISGAIFEHGWYCSLFIHDLYCMIYREVCIYGKCDISIYTLKREIKCLVPLWNIVIFIIICIIFGTKFMHNVWQWICKTFMHKCITKKNNNNNVSYKLFCCTVTESLVYRENTKTKRDEHMHSVILPKLLPVNVVYKYLK